MPMPYSRAITQLSFIVNTSSTDQQLKSKDVIELVTPEECISCKKNDLNCSEENSEKVLSFD